MSAPAPALSIFDIFGPVVIGASGFPTTFAGPVGVPCIKRNDIRVANALTAADMALAGN